MERAPTRAWEAVPPEEQQQQQQREDGGQQPEPGPSRDPQHLPAGAQETSRHMQQEVAGVEAQPPPQSGSPGSSSLPSLEEATPGPSSSMLAGSSGPSSQQVLPAFSSSSDDSPPPLEEVTRPSLPPSGSEAVTSQAVPPSGKPASHTSSEEMTPSREELEESLRPYVTLHMARGSSQSVAYHHQQQQQQQLWQQVAAAEVPLTQYGSLGAPSLPSLEDVTSLPSSSMSAPSGPSGLQAQPAYSYSPDDSPPPLEDVTQMFSNQSLDSASSEAVMSQTQPPSGNTASATPSEAVSSHQSIPSCEQQQQTLQTSVPQHVSSGSSQSTAVTSRAPLPFLLWRRQELLRMLLKEDEEAEEGSGSGSESNSAASVSSRRTPSLNSSLYLSMSSVEAPTSSSNDSIPSLEDPSGQQVATTCSCSDSIPPLEEVIVPSSQQVPPTSSSSIPSLEVVTPHHFFLPPPPTGSETVASPAGPSFQRRAVWETALQVASATAPSTYQLQQQQQQQQRLDSDLLQQAVEAYTALLASPGTSQSLADISAGVEALWAADAALSVEVQQPAGPPIMVQQPAGPPIMVQEAAGLSWLEAESRPPVTPPEVLERPSGSQEGAWSEAEDQVEAGGPSTHAAAEEDQQQQQQSSAERRKRAHSVESLVSDKAKRQILQSRRTSQWGPDSPSRDTPETSLSPATTDSGQEAGEGMSTSDAATSSQEEREGEGEAEVGGGSDAGRAQQETTGSRTGTRSGDTGSWDLPASAESSQDAGPEGAGVPAGVPADPASGGAEGALREVPTPETGADVWADSDPARLTVLPRRVLRLRSIENMPSPARRVLELTTESDPDPPLTGAPTGGLEKRPAAEHSSPQEVQVPSSTSADVGHGSRDLPAQTASSQEAAGVAGPVKEQHAPAVAGAEAGVPAGGGASESTTTVLQAPLGEVSPDTGDRRHATVEPRQVPSTARRSLQLQLRTTEPTADSPLTAAAATEGLGKGLAAEPSSSSSHQDDTAAESEAPSSTSNDEGRRSSQDLLVVETESSQEAEVVRGLTEETVGKAGEEPGAAAGGVGVSSGSHTAVFQTASGEVPPDTGEHGEPSMAAGLQQQGDEEGKAGMKEEEEEEEEGKAAEEEPPATEGRQLRKRKSPKKADSSSSHAVFWKKRGRK